MFYAKTTAILVVCACTASLQAQPPQSKTVPLYNGKNFSGWYKYASDKKVNTEELISIDPFEKHIVIKGTSPGYLVTDNMYRDYELGFEWRWALSDRDKPQAKVDEELKRQSGILVHIISEGDSIWPKSIKAQLQAGRAGDLFVVSGFKFNVHPERKDPRDPLRALRSHDGVEKPLGEWNQGTITCHGKFVSITINGTQVMAGRDAEYSRGRIALQSQAGEIHFRNITLKQLEGKPVDPEKDN